MSDYVTLWLKTSQQFPMPIRIKSKVLLMASGVLCGLAPAASLILSLSSFSFSYPSSHIGLLCCSSVTKHMLSSGPWSLLFPLLETLSANVYMICSLMSLKCLCICPLITEKCPSHIPTLSLATPFTFFSS